LKALSIDGAISRLTISAKNEDKIFTSIYDIGMKQSESIVPAIDYVLEKTELKASDLDYCVISLGPGSFTGLRLAISAVKAIELAYDVPVYGISTLDMYSYPFENFETPVLSVIDANKNRYYASFKDNKKIILKDDDWPVENIIKTLKKYKKIIISGPDRIKIKEIIEAQNKKIKCYIPQAQLVTAEILFELAEKKITAKEPSLKDFDGPLYLRASEAEIKNSK